MRKALVHVRVLSGAALACAALLVLAGCAPEPGSHSGSTASKKPESSQSPSPTPSEGKTPAPEPPPNPGLDQATLDARLRAAAWANDAEASKQLLAWGANVNAADDTVQSAYLIATSEGRLELLNLYLDHGGDVAALDSWNGTGLIRAAERGHWDVVGRLITARVALDHVNNLGFQAVHEAVWLGRDDPTYHATIRVLVAGGAEFTRPSVEQGLTPLQMAEQRGFGGSAALLRAFAEGGVPENPDAALRAAAQSGDADAAALAVRAGADRTRPGDNGQSLIEVAEVAGSIDVAQLLRALS